MTDNDLWTSIMGERPRVLLIGVDAPTQSLLAHSLKHAEVTSIPLDLEVLMEPINPEPKIILASSPSVELSAEIAQALRMQYQIPIYLCCTMQNGFERKDFIKNGFTDAFLMPMDINPLRVALNEAIALSGADDVEVYRSVKMLDLEAGETLDFDTSVFLPGNNKYVKISHSGEEIDSARLEKIKNSKINNLYVPSKDIQKFYQYSAKKLHKLGKEGAMSATERKEKLMSSVRELMSGMFSEQTASFQSGQSVLKTCGGIVSAYIVEGAESEWFLRIQQVIGEFGDNYSHASNVSTLAALFSMGTGIGKPADLALAGLLHDIGKSLLPADVQGLEASEMNPDQLAAYKKHPEMSVNLIRQKKISVPEIVTKIILQHHELFNGSGFPHGYFGDRITKEAQVLALADQFDHITKLKPGQPLITPAEAVQMLRKEQVDDPAKIKYSPDILNALLQLFPSPSSS